MIQCTLKTTFVHKFCSSSVINDLCFVKYSLVLRHCREVLMFHVCTQTLGVHKKVIHT